jgi:hypothetical protein
VHRHFFNGSATAEMAAAGRTARRFTAILGESARWGDNELDRTRVSGPPAESLMTQYFPQRDVLNNCTREPLSRTWRPPQQGSPNFGEIYHTLTDRPGQQRGLVRWAPPGQRPTGLQPDFDQHGSQDQRNLLWGRGRSELR